MTSLVRVPSILLVFALALSGCDGLGSSGPSSPSGVYSPQPIVSTISINTGSSSGGTPLRITGTGFQKAARVTFGDRTVDRRGYDPRVAGGLTGSLIVNTPPHVLGLVDVIVTNPDGQAHRLPDAYEYRAQQSFDFNGDWSGGGSDGSHIGVGLTIRDNELIAASWSCDGGDLTTVMLASAADGGQFSAAEADAFRILGRIVSPSDAIGEITVASCGHASWHATRLPR